MKTKNTKILVGDFETTVFKDQTYTEVWASAIVELYTEDVKIFHSINETFDYLFDLTKHSSIILYYHNLKFDGAFILDYLIRVLKWKQAYTQSNQNNNQTIEWINNIQQMHNKTFKYVISDMGQWYSITIKYNNRTIEIRDSLKLLPFSVKRIDQSFATKHKKLDMKYEGFRYAGCEITDEEKEYIKNDVLVVKEALQIMYEEGHSKLTIGSCCLSEFKTIITPQLFKELFPRMDEIYLDENIYGSSNADVYIRKSYKGGWCYLVKGKEGKTFTNGITLDVNSLYPSVMSCGYKYPAGNPTFWSGDYIPDEALESDSYYFIRVRTRFEIKDGYLPFIQIKNNLLYNGNECLESSDIIYQKNKSRYYKKHGEILDTKVILTFTCSDWELVKEHYNLFDCEILDGCWFKTNNYLFDLYIEKYKKIKMTSKNARRELAKLFLNNLYGKLATSDNNSFKLAYLKPDGAIGFEPVIKHDKKVVYIPCGSAITSYARNFTIRTAQKNYHGVDQRGFIYADTDSIHADLPIEEIDGVELSDSEFCKWKLESQWDIGKFVRQKTYIEHITHEGTDEIEHPYYNVKCAGMPEKCKELFINSMTGEYEESNYNEDEIRFMNAHHTIDDFKVGLTVPSKLMPKRITGGIVLKDTTYEIR